MSAVLMRLLVKVDGLQFLQRSSLEVELLLVATALVGWCWRGQLGFLLRSEPAEGPDWAGLCSDFSLDVVAAVVAADFSYWTVEAAGRSDFCLTVEELDLDLAAD